MASGAGVKMRDGAAGTRRGPRRTEPASVRSGRTLAEVAWAG